MPSYDMKVKMKLLSLHLFRLRYLQQLLLHSLHSMMQDIKGNISSMHREVRAISTCVEQSQLDIQEYLTHHHPDED
jgi:hypothetical protein